MAHLTDLHMLAAQKILKYLKAAPGQGLLLHTSYSLQLVAYCDLDWASCPNIRRSVTGYCIFLGSSLISQKSKKQSIIYRSLAEAEYRSMAATCFELTQLRFLLSAFHVSHPQAALLHCDNQATLHIAANLVLHERTRLPPQTRQDSRWQHPHLSCFKYSPIS